MLKTILFLFCALWSIILNAQQKIIPTWKEGDAWKVKSVDYKNIRNKLEQHIWISEDTLYQEYIIKVEERRKNGFVMSIQLLRYENVSGYDVEYLINYIDLYGGMKNEAPIRYFVNHDGMLEYFVEEFVSEEFITLEDVSYSSFPPGGTRVAILNDSIIDQYAKRWYDETNQKGYQVDETAPIIDAVPLSDKEIKRLEKEYLSKDSRKRVQKQRKEEKKMEKFRLFSDEEWEEIKRENERTAYEFYAVDIFRFYEDLLKQIHAPYGIAIQDYNAPYSVDTISDMDLKLMELEKHMLDLVEINHTHQFSKGEYLEFSSNISVNTDELIKEVLRYYEENYRGNRTKSQNPDQQVRVLTNFLFETGMQSTWKLENVTHFPLHFSRRVFTKATEHEEEKTRELRAVIEFEPLH